MSIYLEINTRESSTLKSAIMPVRFFNSFKMDLIYDSVASTFGFDMLFDHNNQEHREIACVTHYHEARVFFEHDQNNPARNQKLITGYILSQAFTSAAKKELVPIGGYSKAGVLEDCDIPVSLYPLESNGLTFRQIVTKLLQPWAGKKGIKFHVKSSNADKKFQDDLKKVDTTIKKSTAPESRNIKSYLAELANKKNLVLTHDANGDLVITRANTNGTPILDIDADKNPLVGYEKMELVFNGQSMHSDITVVRQADIDGGNSAEKTIENPFCPIVYRPKVVQMTSSEEIDMDEILQAELGKELKSVTLTITLRNPVALGKFITPNNIILVKSRENYLFTKQKWFIERVHYEKDQSEQLMILTCVLPYVYNYYTKNADGKTTGPFNYFVDVNHNFPEA